jgi:hypothetical protein
MSDGLGSCRSFRAAYSGRAETLTPLARILALWFSQLTVPNCRKCLVHALSAEQSMDDFASAWQEVCSALVHQVAAAAVGRVV